MRQEKSNKTKIKQNNREKNIKKGQGIKLRNKRELT